METERMIVEYIDALSESMRESMRSYRNQPEYRELFCLSITQLHYLHAVKKLSGITLTELSAYFKVKKPTVTNVVNRLVRQGYIEKKQSAKDLRVYHLSLTARGMALLDLEKEGYYAFARQMTEVISEQEKEDFTKTLAKIFQCLQE